MKNKNYSSPLSCEELQQSLKLKQDIWTVLLDLLETQLTTAEQKLGGKDNG